MITVQQITLQQAVKSAKTYLAELDPDEPYRDLRVEEVDRNEKGDWEITLGFHRKIDITIFGAGSIVTGQNQIARENRVYKIVEIDALGTPKGKDRMLVADKENVMWARFMDLETNEPFFSSRDGIKKKTMAEIDYERRNGYAWYGNSPAKLINNEFPKWAARWKVN